ncbi:MAG TPA: hypothetical protein VFA46_10305 [Actinomycetes bacterium]|nr:hypothetical protein [Actinomycetes bacterium]
MVLAGVLVLTFATTAHAQTVMVKDWNYGATADGTGGAMTGQKPESKLWFVDGKWWSVMVPPGGGPYHFYTLAADGTQWQDQGLGGDDREFTKPDVLFDATGSKLYIASRDGSATEQNRLYRYSFDGSGFTLDDGFPVDISGGGEETLTIAKDSTGKLWIAYTVSNKVKVNRSTTDDATWGTQFTVPVVGAKNVLGDDIAAVQAFDGKIGVFWSNQKEQQDYFAYHTDGEADTSGWSVEVAYSGPKAADDHVNLKTGSDGSIWAVVKTSKDHLTDPAAEPLIVLLHRTPMGSWSATEVWKVADDATRPICLLDEASGRVYVLAQVVSGKPDGIYYKSASLLAPTFPSGLGTALITGSGKPNDATSTKQNLSPATGLVALASTRSSDYYWHAKLTFG